MARKAETGVSRSALTDFTTGTSVASRARRENCLKSGCSIVGDPQPRSRRAQSQEEPPELAAFHYRGRRVERGCLERALLPAGLFDALGKRAEPALSVHGPLAHQSR